MSNQKYDLITILKETLSKDRRFITESGDLVKASITSASMQLEPEFINLLLSNEILKRGFFTEIDNVLVFDKVKFNWVVNNKQFLPDSYTKYKNKIGLSNNDIQFSNVTFSYNQRDYIINKFTKNIKEGSKIYIEGKNGSGKSTLTKLLTKIIIPNDGKIYLGNQDYETLPVNFVREKITYSTQDNYIFKGTLKENLFIDTTNDRQQKIIHSLVSDGILDNILSNFQNGWETLINEKGTNLSEGQKQIIGICRLLIIGSPIMIFDETISKIDNHTQEKLIDFIFDHFSKHTCIFIDHSAKMKERCTEVIKLDS